MQLLLLLFLSSFAIVECKKNVNMFNDVDICISLIQKYVKGKTTTKALSGLVGIGWDDMTNSPTLPILAIEFKNCRTDSSNSYLLPDNVFAIPIEQADVERTSTQIDTFKSMMEENSNKIGVSASATVKGVQVGGSFSSENQQRKDSFEKQTSIMLLNKIHYSAFELFVDENKGFDKYFLERLEEIAEAVAEKKMLWGKFLAEVFISDFGTHLVNKAIAGAEILQETYIDKSETYKSEKTMDAYKAEVSLGFKAIAKVTIGYESKKETSETHTTSSVTTNSILRTRGGPDVSRISGANKNASMLYVENLVGLKQSGKYLFEVISAVQLPKHSTFVKYTVRELIQNATEDYYSYNFRPGCMDSEHENFNKLANTDDGSCINPTVLFGNGGIYQICTPLSAKTEDGENVPFSNRCENHETQNPKTNTFSCGDKIDEKMVSSIIVEYNDRKAKAKKEKCGFFSFIFGCKNETVEVNVNERFQLTTFWCPTNLTVTQNQDHQIKTMNGIGKVATVYDSMARAFSNVDEDDISSIRYYGFRNSSTIDLWIFGKPEVSSQSVSYRVASREGKLLKIERRQFNMIKHYPEVMKRLLPLLDIPRHLHYMRNISDSLVKNPKLLEELIFKEKSQNLYKLDAEQLVHFGGAYKTGTLNPFTGKYECPPYFQPVTILIDLNLCLSTEKGMKWPLRLGGFFNCTSDLKICPLGYSQYLGTIYNGCEFYYCIRFHTRDEITPAVINRPPYTDYKLANKETIPID